MAHPEQAEQFYRELQQGNVCVRVGMESSGHSRWFERLLQELQYELWIGDPAQILSKRVRKQKTDRQDARADPYPSFRIESAYFGKGNCAVRGEHLAACGSRCWRLYGTIM